MPLDVAFERQGHQHSNTHIKPIADFSFILTSCLQDPGLLVATASLSSY
jgi:hypothetical protein